MIYIKDNTHSFYHTNIKNIFIFYLSKELFAL